MPLSEQQVALVHEVRAMVDAGNDTFPFLFELNDIISVLEQELQEIKTERGKLYGALNEIGGYADIPDLRFAIEQISATVDDIFGDDKETDDASF